MLLQTTRRVPGGLYVLLMFYFFIFLFFFSRPISIKISGITERTFTKLSGLAELCKCLINLAFIRRSLGDVAKATNLSRKIGVLGGRIFNVALPFCKD